jgi:hypothetical protein
MWRDSVVLSREEAALDPDYAEAAAAWTRGDDSSYEASEAVDHADAVIQDALPDDVESIPNRTYHDTKSANDIEVLNTFHEIQGRYVAETVRLMREGRPVAAAQLARLICRDAKSVALGLGGTHL